MLLDKSGKLVKSLDFRGTKVEFLDKITAKDLFMMIAKAQQMVNSKDGPFKARDLAPSDWSKTVYQHILDCCDDDKMTAYRLFGVIIKQALIMTPLLFSTEGGEDQWDGTIYTKETLKF